MQTTKSNQAGERTRAINLAINLAAHLLSLPSGSWPETQQARQNLDDAIQFLPGWTRKTAIDLAKKNGCKLHPSRID